MAHMVHLQFGRLCDDCVLCWDCRWLPSSTPMRTALSATKRHLLPRQRAHCRSYQQDTTEYLNHRGAQIVVSGGRKREVKSGKGVREGTGPEGKEGRRLWGRKGGWRGPESTHEKVWFCYPYPLVVLQSQMLASRFCWTKFRKICKMKRCFRNLPQHFLVLSWHVEKQFPQVSPDFAHQRF